MKKQTVPCALMLFESPCFSLKWKELRNRGDETARLLQAHQLEGVEPSANLRRDFEHLLELVRQ